MSDIDRSCANASRGRREHWLGWAIAGVLAAGAARAHGQPAEATAVTPGENVRPWAAGVSEAEQATALELYRAGNLEFAESRFAQALAKYRDAIRHWDHPAIRFNMAVCLINLDQPLEAKGSLERSLAYGDGPLGAEAFSQGLTYRKLLDAQLAQVKIACPEPGTLVTLDGRFLFTGPGSVVESLLPGGHQVVATKPAFLTASKALVLVAGKLTTYDIGPLERPLATRTVRRWAPWKPWAVLGAAGALAGAGAISYVAAKHNFASYDRGISADCPHGCDPAMLMALSPSYRRARDRGDVEQVAAFSLFSAAGAVAVAAVIAVIANQPRVQLESHHAQPAVAPVSGGAALLMNWGF
jgi:hypothetical protein